MKIISYTTIISIALALTDYFQFVKDMPPQLNNGTEWVEEWHPNQFPKVGDSDGIQILSTAIHGGFIEAETEIFAEKLYKGVQKSRIKSMVYKFISKINSKQSGSVKTQRCITKQCCRKITSQSGDNRAFNETMCASFKKVSVDLCNERKVCYSNAAHVTSAEFMTPILNEILPSRYPVSFHGFVDRNDTTNLPVDIVLGGLSDQKHRLAKMFHSLSNKYNYRVAVCNSPYNCRVYDPRIINFNDRVIMWAPSLSGTSKYNFVNKGVYKCGLQIELSKTFRNIAKTPEDHWDLLINSIIATFPSNKDDMCGKSENESKVIRIISRILVNELIVIKRTMGSRL